MRAGRALFCGSILPALLAAFGCEETRRPIGEECLRHEDCLSTVCAARTCVPAPELVSGTGDPADDEPRIPEKEAGTDAAGDGGIEAG